MHDTVIRGGRVVDGTGAEPFTADIAIDAGKIIEIGRVTSPAREVIDADTGASPGRLVCWGRQSWQARGIEPGTAFPNP